MGERFDTSRPIYAQIVERLKAKILAGVYPPGGHLDSVRDLAAAAGVNPNTMQRALAQLEAEGLVRTERTTGGIGYGPAQAAALVTGWETKESERNE